MAIGTRLVRTALAALVLATTAAAASPPRFKLKPRWSKVGALANAERRVNRAVGFSAADCWMSDGDARVGWRHGNCIGKYTYGATTYRFRAVYTPVSCTRERAVITVPGIASQRKVVRAPRAGGFRIAC